jgi:hypothetical protein
MRWRFLRRRLSAGAPRLIIRRHMPWPLRWAVFALMLGFSAAIALWAFEFGREIAGLDRLASQELQSLQSEVTRLRAENERALAVANTAESLLRAERSAQERLAQTVRRLEGETQSLKEDLGFFERLLPAEGDGLLIRGVQAEAVAPGQLRYQLLVMQGEKNAPEFTGRYEVVVVGDREGRPWSQSMAGGAKPVRIRQYARVEGLIEVPQDVRLKSVQVRVTDQKGALRASQTAPL